MCGSCSVWNQWMGKEKKGILRDTVDTITLESNLAIGKVENEHTLPVSHSTSRNMP